MRIYGIARGGCPYALCVVCFFTNHEQFTRDWTQCCRSSIRPRRAGTAAKVTLTVSGRDGVQVPKGSAFLTVAGVRFLTDAAAVIADGLAQIAAVAAEAGITGNVAAG